ncbi:hypothetical protein SLS53_006314 [Cytospora paraplurivora]|uniref:Major facilitator superfamily (MFS) profile domain-containing protein n=1 Tax=Cytospora paraplurivora TaxID=2898453 RepID=A0AAN9YFB0_9PEZI
MAADQEKSAGDAVPQSHPGTGKDLEKATSNGRHDQPASLNDEEHIDEKTRQSVHEEEDGREDDDDDDDDDEYEQHHDPEPEGPAGLNFGFPPDQEAQATQVRSRSRASSARSRPLVIVPRRERRGLFSQFTIIPEVERPYDYSRKTKWIITTVVALAAAGGPLGSNITYRDNIAMLIVFRVLGGGAAASVQAVGAGTISDLWEPFERGQAMGTFYLGPLMGPLFAPIIGGALAQGFNWQATMWFVTAFGGVNLISLFFLLPETLARRKAHVPPPADTTNNDTTLDRTPTRQSVADKAKNTAGFLRKAFIDPLTCIKYLRFPPVALTVALASVTFAALFIQNISIQSTFGKSPYNFSIIIVGLLYIPGSLGYLAASLVGGRWVDKIMVREAKKAGRYDAGGKLILLPEDRLREQAWIAASMYPFAMIWFGWCADKGVFWFATIVANFFFGVACMLIFGAGTTMLTEFMPRRSSSGVALNNFVRNIFSCVGVVVTEPLISAMGVGWLCTMVALIAWITANVCIFTLVKKSSGWRKMMDEKMATMK